MGGSNIKNPNVFMGWWGSLGSPEQKFVTMYTVSPYATKPLKNFMHNAIFNTVRRVKKQIIFFVLPITFYGILWKRCKDYNEYLYSKAGKKELERLSV